MKVKIAATQMSCDWEIENNLNKAIKLVETAAQKEANIILLQELFLTPYFCIQYDEEIFKLAQTFEDSTLLKTMSDVAKKNNVVLPISFFEKENNSYFNSLAVIDADGSILGKYRKSHIPDGPGYLEKYYFNPGDTGFQVWETKFGKIGIGICWDQWFPEAARAMVLKGAEILLYPTAIGGEEDEFDSSDMWQRAMIGHSAQNQIPVIASNRIGTEEGIETSNYFYGRSFITNHIGDKIAEGSRDKEEVLIGKVDLLKAEKLRTVWGTFRDRRPELYRDLLNLDGS